VTRILPTSETTSGRWEFSRFGPCIFNSKYFLPMVRIGFAGTDSRGEKARGNCGKMIGDVIMMDVQI